ncbi:MAG: hypothetical protein M1553_11325 [Firmicutes bacterium]|nr:hypothetical protein [Bacillota bacterium]
MTVPDYQSMSKEELQKELIGLQEELEDLEQERQYTLGQTGVHISAKQLAAMEEEFNSDRKKIEDKIQQVKVALAKK